MWLSKMLKPFTTLIDGSTHSEWIFSDPPDFVLKNHTLFTRFKESIETDIIFTKHTNDHFEELVSLPFWNFL